MKILLLAATQQEIQPFLQIASTLDVLIGGVGVPSTVYHLTKRLHHHHYDLVIQAGIAGCFDNTKLQLGEVVVVKQDCFGDLGALEKHDFYSVQQLGLSGEHECIINNNNLLKKIMHKQVKAITVNTVSNNTDIINMLQRRWNADIETMEGAALHYVCHHQQVNYLQLRSISNMVGIRDKSQWYIKEAIANMNDVLEEIIMDVKSIL